MRKIRLIFEKTGSARFVSHLDLNRVMQRAVRRAHLPVWYTEGFNCHPYVTFASPLSLGFCSLYELMDAKITQDDLDFSWVPARLNATLPRGLRVREAYEPESKFSAIAASRYEIALPGLDAPGGEALRAAMTGGELLAVKKGKAGEYTIDLAPHVRELTLERRDGALYLGVTLPASQTLSINPALLLDAALGKAGLQATYLVTRTSLLDEAGHLFR